MEKFLIEFMRVAMWVSMIAFPLFGFVWRGGVVGRYGIDWPDAFGAIGGFITAALSFGIVAILLKIEQNTRSR